MNGAATKTDVNAREWAITDDVVRLRHWGGDRVYLLPEREALIGTSDDCTVQLVDPSGHTSRSHARIVSEGERWIIRDLGSKNGIRLDGARRDVFELEPGIEIGIGGLTLIAESGRLIALRRLLARFLGWKGERTEVVDHALRAVRVAATRRAALVVCGGSDSITVAHAIHRLALGSDRPFIACDPRRRDAGESVRAVRNFTTAAAALAHANGGSLCVWSSRLPRDFRGVQAALRQQDAPAQLVVCSGKPDEGELFLAVPMVVPPLASRLDEIEHVIREYGEDTVTELGVPPDSFQPADRAWIREHAASSLSEIEKATLRLVALRACGNINRAAAMLKMAHVSLSRWVARWKVQIR